MVTAVPVTWPKAMVPLTDDPLCDSARVMGRLEPGGNAPRVVLQK